jgi:transcriptional regulator with XRE-family HTH domain
MSTSPRTECRTIVCVDVQGFGDLRRTNLDQAEIRRGLYRALSQAFDRSGALWARCEHEDRGDGVLVLMPTEVPKSPLVTLLPRELAAALREHNQNHDVHARIQLRMAVHAGEILYDEYGKTSLALTHAFRLLAAETLKRALTASSGVLAVIASEPFYREVIVNIPASDRKLFRQADVFSKETVTTAWISLPDDHYAPGQRAMTPIAGHVTVGADPFVSLVCDAATHEHAGPTVARMALGERLRRLRGICGLSRRQVGTAIHASESKIRRMEQGATGYKVEDVAALLTLYGITSKVERAETFDLAAQANMRGWMHFYSDVLTDNIRTGLELEQVAGLVRCYEPQFIPYLLQTADYARSIMRIGNRDIPPAHMDRWINLLGHCQRILNRPQPTRLWMIIDEAALYRGGRARPRMMRKQLEHLIAITDLPHITIQVMPADTGVAAGGGIKILRLPERDLTQVACLEQLTSTIYLVERGDVDHYRQVMDRLSVHAETPGATRHILYRILKGD